MTSKTKDNPPTVLITGATGLLGRQVMSAFSKAGWRTVGTGFSRAKPPSIHKLDLTDQTAVTELLATESPNVVIHCAAERFPDKVADNPAFATALNTAATQHLASLCAARSILLLYLSTDYVFPGHRGEAPYHPSTPPSPPNLYGRTKRDGELAVLGSSGGIVLRVPVLYGAVDDNIGNKESAVNTLLDSVWAAQEPGREVKVDDWSIRYPTNTEDVARVVLDVVKRWEGMGTEERARAPRILHFSATQPMTKYRICEVLAEVLGVGMGGLVRDRPADGDGGGVGGASRPYDTGLDIGVLKELGIEDRSMEFEAWWRWHVKAYRK